MRAAINHPIPIQISLMADALIYDLAISEKSCFRNKGAEKKQNLIYFVHRSLQRQHNLQIRLIFYSKHFLN